MLDPRDRVAVECWPPARQGGDTGFSKRNPDALRRVFIYFWIWLIGAGIAARNDGRIVEERKQSSRPEHRPHIVGAHVRRNVANNPQTEPESLLHQLEQRNRRCKRRRSRSVITSPNVPPMSKKTTLNGLSSATRRS